MQKSSKSKPDPKLGTKDTPFDLHITSVAEGVYSAKAVGVLATDHNNQWIRLLLQPGDAGKLATSLNDALSAQLSLLSQHGPGALVQRVDQNAISAVEIETLLDPRSGSLVLSVRAQDGKRHDIRASRALIETLCKNLPDYLAQIDEQTSS